MEIYIVKFAIYTMAMIGTLFAALFVFKKFALTGFTKKSSILKVEDTMKLSPKKTLHIINVGGEKYLIASDIDRTSLIAKLNGKEKVTDEKIQTLAAENNKPAQRQDRSTKLSSFDGVKSLKQFSTSTIDFNRGNAKKAPVMRELAKKLASVR